MSEEILRELHIIAENINNLSMAIEKTSGALWNTQWFAALIGALAATIVGLLIKYTGKRIEKLTNFYNFLIQNRVWIEPESLIERASSISYGRTVRHNDGKTIVYLEKPISEKVVIELRKLCKYWRLPISYVRLLFKKYEFTLQALPNQILPEIKKSLEYQQSDILFKKIMDLVEKKTGETEWTRR